MSPLPGWQVIPTGWSERQRPTMDLTRTSPGRILRSESGPPPWPVPEGWGLQEVYSGKFRVQQLNRQDNPVPGNQPTQERGYLIVAGMDIPALQAGGDLADIVEVEGRRFRLEQVLHGSQLWEMDLMCTENLTQQNER